MKKNSSIPLNNELIDTSGIEEMDILDLTDCIYNYLMILVEYGFLLDIYAHNKHDSKFEVIYDQLFNLHGLTKNQVRKKIEKEIEDENMGINNIKNYQKQNPWENKEGVCRECGIITRVWVVFDSIDNICLCRNCDRAGK